MANIGYLCPAAVADHMDRHMTLPGHVTPTPPAVRGWISSIIVRDAVLRLSAVELSKESQPSS